MGAVHPTVLANARDAAVGLMPETAQVIRPVLTDDGYGGTAGTDEVIATVPARVRLLTGQELPTADKLARYTTYRVAVPYGTDVAPADALLIGGTRYEVVAVPADSFALELRTLCKAVS